MRKNAMLSFPTLAVAALLAACSSGSPQIRVATPSLHVADAELASGLSDSALQVTRSILEVQPRDVPALLKQGEILLAMGKPEESAECFRRAEEIAPGNPATLASLGRLQLALGHDKDAEATFRKLIAAAPGDATAHNDLGIALDMQGRAADAQAAYRAALQATPDDRAAKINLGLSLAISGHGDEALAILRPLEASAGADRRFQHDLAAAFVAAGNQDEAKRILAADLPPGDVAQAVQAYQSLSPDAARDTVVTARAVAATGPARGLPAARSAAVPSPISPPAGQTAAVSSADPVASVLDGDPTSSDDDHAADAPAVPRPGIRPRPRAAVVLRALRAAAPRDVAPGT
jgi:Flp pilus assembly protein TadD